MISQRRGVNTSRRYCTWFSNCSFWQIIFFQSFEEMERKLDQEPARTFKLDKRYVRYIHCYLYQVFVILKGLGNKENTNNCSS